MEPTYEKQHIRTTNVIDSAYAALRLRTAKMRGQGTMVMILAMVFKLAERAQLRWQRLRAHRLASKAINAVKAMNGIEETLAT